MDTLAVTNNFGYNLRSELASAAMGTNSFAYQFDPIGNRLTATNNADVLTYFANVLNQYSSVTSVVQMSYDLDGNLTNDSVRACSWDGENRLTGVTGTGLAASYNYDYMSRRVSKTVNGVTTTFIYDGWNLIYEITGTHTNQYVWGLDLSQSQQGAGGIGGLVKVLKDGVPFYPVYDANGNITRYVDATGTIVTGMDCDAYGNAIHTIGDVTQFSFWFSTKYRDTETGWYYYGYRYYDPSTGRWPSKDPSEEAGGVGLYLAFLNNSNSYVDRNGGDNYGTGGENAPPTSIGFGPLNSSPGVPGITTVFIPHFPDELHKPEAARYSSAHKQRLSSLLQ